MQACEEGMSDIGDDSYELSSVLKGNLLGNNKTKFVDYDNTSTVFSMTDDGSSYRQKTHISSRINFWIDVLYYTLFKKPYYYDLNGISRNVDVRRYSRILKSTLLYSVMGFIMFFVIFNVSVYMFRSGPPQEELSITITPTISNTVTPSLTITHYNPVPIPPPIKAPPPKRVIKPLPPVKKK